MVYIYIYNKGGSHGKLPRVMGPHILTKGLRNLDFFSWGFGGPKV